MEDDECEDYLDLCEEMKSSDPIDSGADLPDGKLS